MIIAKHKTNFLAKQIHRLAFKSMLADVTGKIIGKN